MFHNALILALFACVALGQRAGDVGTEPVDTVVKATNPETALSDTDKMDPAKVEAAWATAYTRPAKQADIDTRKAARAKNCSATLSFGPPARAADGRTAHQHPTLGIVILPADMHAELLCVPQFDVQPENADMKWLKAYLSGVPGVEFRSEADGLPKDWEGGRIEP